jgi:hypothetical protein
MPTTRKQLVARLGYGESAGDLDDFATFLEFEFPKSVERRLRRRRCRGSESGALDAGGERSGRVAVSPASHSSRPGVPRNECTPAGVVPSVLPWPIGRKRLGQAAVVCELQLTSWRVACVRGKRSRRPALKRVTPTGRPSQAAVTQSLLAMRQRRRVLRRGETRPLRLLTKSTR